jgi:succinate dehydrogenase / fumarate reductase cytochrome b subunit
MNVLLGTSAVSSSLGKKYLMAITGLALIGFVVVHMSGNLLVFAGPDALNTYAQALKARPPLLWGARLGLALVFVLHVWLGISLTRQNQAARPQRYVYEDTLQATWASRHMMLTGLVLLAFILYHLAHFTLGVVKPADVQVVKGVEVHLDPPKHYLDLTEERAAGSRHYVARPDLDLQAQGGTDLDTRHDVYSMVISGFRNPWITASYLLAMVFLGLHLWHGGSSWFQSLGINGPRLGKFTHAVGPVLAVLVVAGNCSIPLAVWLGIVH